MPGNKRNDCFAGYTNNGTRHNGISRNGSDHNSGTRRNGNGGWNASARYGQGSASSVISGHSDDLADVHQQAY